MREFPELIMAGSDSNGNNHYDGSCGKRVIIIGIPNRPLLNNSKIAAHEICHLFLDPISGMIEYWGRVVNHCDNFTGNGYCIMKELYNIRASMKYWDNCDDRIMDRVFLGFCQPCYDKLNLAARSLRLFS